MFPYIGRRCYYTPISKSQLNILYFKFAWDHTVVFFVCLTYLITYKKFLHPCFLRCVRVAIDDWILLHPKYGVSSSCHSENGGVGIIKVFLNHIVITGLGNRPSRGMGGAGSTLIFFLSSMIKFPMKEIMRTTRLICFEYFLHVLICTSPSAQVPWTFVITVILHFGELKYYCAFGLQSYVDLQYWSFLASL